MQKATLAPQIIIRWDPVKDDGSIRFDFREFMLDETGKPTAYANINEIDIHTETIMQMAVRLADLTGFETDPVTQQTLPSSISGAMIMRCIKEMTNVIIAERARQKAEQKFHFTINQAQDSYLTTIDFSMSTFEASEIVDVTVDWGDGSAAVTQANLNNMTHTYADVVEPTQYDVVVTLNTTDHTGLTRTYSMVISPIATSEPDPAP